MESLAWILGLGTLTPAAGEEALVRSQNPAYELALPGGYREVLHRGEIYHFVRSSGTEPWARISLLLGPADGPLLQSRAGASPEQIRPQLDLPPECKETFRTASWNGLEIGLIEYRTVIKDLPMIGLATLVPLKEKALKIIISAPDPLEAEVRGDFQLVLGGITRAETNWHTPSELRRIDLMTNFSRSGWALVALYPLAWMLAFRSHPMSFHWVRTVWLAAAALLLFIPISSPGAVSENHLHLLETILMPAILVSFVIRRLRMAIEMG